MSFFDEADEPPVEPRVSTRRSRPSGGGRRPPRDDQAILIRRGIAVGALLVVIVLMVLGIHSCQVSARNSSLKDYTNNVSSINQQSAATGTQVFKILSSGGGQSNATTMYNQLNDARVSAQGQLDKAKGLDVPDEMRGAQNNFVLALLMRRDGIQDIAQNIQQALGTTTNRDALNAIAGDMARFYSSDVVYKDYTTTEMAGALNSAGIAVGGANGIQIDGSQFVPDLQWLTPSFIAGKIGSQGATPSNAKVAPGTHGHSLDSVTVNGTTLDTGSTNTISASPAPTFTLNFTNSGQNNETNVVCKVTLSGSNISGSKTVAQTTSGQSASCDVTLNASPPAGNYQVTATVQPVPGEKNAANNTQTFPVTFQ